MKSATMKLFLLLSFLFTVESLIAIASGQGVTYCVKLNADATCDTEDHYQLCQTLQYYINDVNTAINLMTNVTIIFVEGTHRVTITAGTQWVMLSPTMKVIGKGNVVKVVCNYCGNCFLAFINNINISTTDLTFVQSQPRNNPPSIEGCHFSLRFWNAATLLENFNVYSSIILVTDNRSFAIQGDSEFAGCSRNAIFSHNSSITVSGKVAFVNNTGAFGAALCLSSSDLRVAADANIVFINNSVTTGGGALYLYSIYQIHMHRIWCKSDLHQ